MEEKKEEIKIKLSTAVIIILILLVALGVMYYFGFVKNKNENIENETLTNATENIEVNNALTNDVEEEKTENVLNNDKTNNENSSKEETEKVSKEKRKQNFQKYLDISSSFNSDSLSILKELELVSEQPNWEDYKTIEYKDVKYQDMNKFYKTDIKYSKYKEKMQQYMTSKCMEKEFANYTRNNNGNLYVVSYGGVTFNFKVQKMEKVSSNVYTIKVFITGDDSGSKDIKYYTVTFDGNKVKEVKSRDYSDISSKLKGKEVFYVTDVVDNSDFDNTYTLKGVIYDETTITKSELNKYLKEKKVEVDGQKYEIKKNEDGYYSLIDSKYDSECYWIKKKNNNTYTLESTTEFPTVYKLTNKYKEITVSGNLKCEYGETQEKTTVKKYFKNFKDRDPIDSTNPDGVFTFNFNKNGNCTKIVECVTGH